jgi:NADPH2:quinone reductase
MSIASDTVRAARLVHHGEPVVVQEVPLPAPAEGEVRVDLRFGGINPIDRYIAEGRVAPDAPLPRTLGGEAAGTLEGEAVLVAGGGLGSGRDGVWAQAANVPRDSVTAIPDGVDLQHAAAMGIAGLTAFNCVRHVARVDKEDRVLVLGASGGVGSMIVSLCAAAGALVWGQTGSEEKAGPIAELGASRVLVATADQLPGLLSELEPTVIFDPLGGPFVAPAIDGLSPRGRHVSFGTSAGPDVSFNMQQLYRKALSIRGYGGMQITPEERRDGLQAALAALSAGELVVRIDSVLSLDEVGEAFRRLAERRVQGNLLLDLS